MKHIFTTAQTVNKKQNMKYGTLPSHERVRIAGAKKVNALKDGFLILVKMVKFFFKL